MSIRGWLVLSCLVGCVGDRGNLAGGAQISDITIYQGPAVPLVRASELVRDRAVPVLAGRAGRLVATLAFEPGSETRVIDVTLELSDAGGTPVTITQPANVPANATPVDVYFDFDAPAIASTTTFSVSLFERDGFISSHDVLGGVRQPAAGAYPLDARAAPSFRVRIVPVGTATAAAPAIDQPRLDRWKARLAAVLPVGDVELTLGAAFDSGRDLTTPDGWTSLLADLAARRAAAGGDMTVFEYGIAGPVPSSMIGGIAATLAVEVPYWRVAAGLISTDPENEATIVAHELGHALGRSHAPCGNPGGPDYAYPYPAASIGVIGFDLRDHAFRTPQQYVDFMSYCAPSFVSDYQFGALFDSLAWLGTQGTASLPAAPAFVIDPVHAPVGGLP